MHLIASQLVPIRGPRPTARNKAVMSVANRRAWRPGGQPDAGRRCRFRRTIRLCRSPYWLGVSAAHMLDLSEFKTSKLPTRPSELAPDGSAVRPLLGLPGGSMAHFELPAAETSRAVAHRTVGELWFVLSGRGELWRKRGTREEVVVLEPGVCVTLPQGTHFQLRASPDEALGIIAATIPRWPGDSDAEFVQGPWSSSAAQ